MIKLKCRCRFDSWEGFFEVKDFLGQFLLRLMIFEVLIFVKIWFRFPRSSNSRTYFHSMFTNFLAIIADVFDTFVTGDNHASGLDELG